MFGQVSAESIDFDEFFDDSADFFMQISSEDRNNIGTILLQNKSTADDFIERMEPESRQRFEQYYA